METSFVQIRQKEVVNVTDGKRLGRTCDVVFTFPEGKVVGIVVPGGKNIFFGKNELFVDIRNITKIGEDTVLVSIPASVKPVKNGKTTYCSEPQPPAPRRSYEEYE